MTPDEMADAIAKFGTHPINLDQQKQLSSEQMGMPSSELDRMKGHPNDPVFSVVESGNQCSVSTGIPIKLELASRFMAGMMANQYLGDQEFYKLAEYATNAADALIECFNNQQKEEK